MADKRTFYGPQACERCGVQIVKASLREGGEEIEYPDAPIYPNTKWFRHECRGAEANAQQGAE